MPHRHSSPPVVPERAPEKLKRPTGKGLQSSFLEGQGELAGRLPDPGLAAPPKPAEKPETPIAPAIPLPPDNAALTPPAISSSGSTDPTHAPEHIAPDAQPAYKQRVIVVDGIEFHHQSEAEFASLLNYYGIEWQYEPHSFPLQWRDGRPIEMFSPDFYLTEYDLYIELTTMRQSLVRRKNRKLRLIRALYPEINIKLLYRRDYQRLLERFGIPPDFMEAEQPPSSEPVNSGNADDSD